MGLPESKVSWVNDRFIADRRVLRYGVIDPTKSVYDAFKVGGLFRVMVDQKTH
jgi:hypothetical protein